MSLSTIIRSKSLSFGVTVLAAFAGTIGGIYLSRSWTDHTPQSNTRNHVGHHYSPGLAFSVGDQFPEEKYVDREGNAGNFADLLRGKKTVVLFVSLGCEPCDNLLEAWHEDMSGRLITGTQSVICLASSTVVPEKYKTLCDSLNIVFFDYQRWLSDYSMSDFPTLIGVGDGNTITDIQFGFVGQLDHGLESRYFKPLL